MTALSIRFRLLLVLFSALVRLAVLFAQETSEAEVKQEEIPLYSHSSPYIDERLPALKNTIHELSKLQPAEDGDRISDLLHKIGDQADEILKQIPDLIADETVNQSRYILSQGNVSGCIAAGGCDAPGDNVVSDAKFDYLILANPAKDGRRVFQEYRMGANGKPIRQGVGTPSFLGFFAAWVVFSSPNQAESRFRYLGQEQIDGRKAFVIGFAQVPGLVESPGVILGNAQPVPMLLQGIAWIDPSNFRIVRLRTDLLTDLPKIAVQRQTTHIVFGTVRIPGMVTSFWLPVSVNLEMDARGEHIQEQHKYSNYRLYRAKTRLIFPPDN